jgi:type II secretory pathway pseudopilin PulG
MIHEFSVSNLNQSANSESGFSIIESLFVLLLSSFVIGATVAGYLSLSKFAQDNETRVLTQLKAQSVLDMITPDIRMIGNGVPFQQSNFLIAQETLSDPSVTQPILVDSTDSHNISFRINESGETYLLTQNFNPSIHSSVSITSTAKISEGDQIYITNFTRGMDDGLWASVSGVSHSSNTLTLSGPPQFHPGAEFPAGSMLEVVPIVTYSSDDNFGQVTRDNGSGPQVIIENGKLTFSFRDGNGNNINFPLLATSQDPFPPSALQNIHTVHITVEIESDSLLRAKSEKYHAQVSQIVGIRNLNYKY